MIYVDALINYGCKLGPSCHLLADNEDELHEFAGGIGMKREWFQLGANGSVPHYDLVASKRKMAIKKGAIEIDRTRLIEMINDYKSKKQLNL